MRSRIWRIIVIAIVVALVAAGCSDDGEDSSDDSSGAGTVEGTITVPDDFDTIQAAVDAAAPGALVLIEPGTYEEEVNVTTDDLTIRGLDRNEVILDGGFELENGIRILEADGVVVENLTAQNYTRNGVFWTGVDGYRGSYLTTIRNGDYGVYAFGSVNGVMEHSYASGSPDAGFYVGQCYPCNAVLDDVTSEYNGLGYSGTNSGGDLFVVNSTFTMNRAGIVTNSGSYEGCAPQRETTIVGNLVYDNSNDQTAAIDDAVWGEDNGILVLGGIDDVVERNRVTGHEIAGIAIVPFPEYDPIAPIPEDPPDTCVENAEAVSEAEQAELDNPQPWQASGNRVAENVATGNAQWDIIFISAAEFENCAEANEADVVSPADLEAVAPCGGPFQDYPVETASYIAAIDADAEPSANYEDVELPDPGDLENMPDAADAPTEPARAPRTVDVAAIVTPDVTS